MSSKINPLTYEQQYTNQIKREQRTTYLKLTIHETIKFTAFSSVTQARLSGQAAVCFLRVDMALVGHYNNKCCPT